MKTRVVNIGKIPLGGDYPVRIQSMTTTDTMDTAATVEQTISLANVGCEYVRITAPSINEAKNLAEIKKELKKRGYDVPLIADIHYTPKAAEVAAQIVEKVRINPGNYVDKKKFQIKEYDDSEYQAELERIEQRFAPLVKICKENGTAMRIGANHGSLSDRIMSRYGDTPQGMVESALEFVKICEKYDYRDIVISMKASNARVMVAAYRLLIQRMEELGMNYPIHLGVTEAGDGLDGRIKSAIGIGALLAEGIGDTIRVSLTEPPEAEIPVAQKIISLFGKNGRITSNEIFKRETNDFLTYKKRKSFPVAGIGGTNPAKVISGFTNQTKINDAQLAELGIDISENKFHRMKTDAPDFLAIKNSNGIALENVLNRTDDEKIRVPVFTFEEIKIDEINSHVIIKIKLEEIYDNKLSALVNNPNVIFMLSSSSDKKLFLNEFKKIFSEFEKSGVENPVILFGEFDFDDEEMLAISSAVNLGALLLDGYGDAIWINSKKHSLKKMNDIAFTILQSARVRITKTEYIACPSCGRTLFDLVETTNKIRKATNHLTGLKIGIMGCIVNGPGEMADADYGYVGAGPGKITLYKGQQAIKKNIDAENALEELIALIKENGDWKEPE